MTAAEFKFAQAQLGMTNQQLADALGVSFSTITKWRGGQHDIPHMVRLALKALEP